MHTIEEMPWIEYLEIDEETGESFLRKDAPQDIREKYEQYILSLKNRDPNVMIPK